jgi:proteasome-associated ATPase
MSTIEGYEDKISELEKALKASNKKLVEQQMFLQKMASPPWEYAMVVNAGSQAKLPTWLSLMGKTITVATDNGTLKEIFGPDDCVKNGDMLLLSGMTSQVVSRAQSPEGGIVVSVKRMLKDRRCEIVLGTESVIVFSGGIELQEGDRAILNERFRIITGKIPVEDGFDIDSDDEISWDDIGGLDDAKKIMRDVIELPYKHPEIFKYYNKKIPKGILLYGPPGCGKTMIGKAVATSVKKIHKISEKGGFIYIKGPEILNKYVGESEAHIRRIFADARKYKVKTKAPAVIFIDEAESILNRRGSGRSSDVDRTIVPMFLAEMDGLSDSAAIVILATNKENLLDPASIREGRVDYKVKVGRPNKKHTADIFHLYIKGMPLLDGDSAMDLSEMAANELFDDERALFRIIDGKQEHFFTMAHIVSGGMIASIVGQATTYALNRDLQLSKRTGLSRKDLVASIDMSHRQNAGIQNREYLDDFIAENHINATKIEKVKL